MDLTEARYSDGAVMVSRHLSRLTVMRFILNDAPMIALNSLLGALLKNDADNAACQYHEMSSALLTGEYRRVSGDVYRDYLLYCLLERENAFSVKAAKSVWDEPLCVAMRADLDLFNTLFSLNSSVLKKWIGECTTPGKPQKQDNIAVMSSAVWSGGALRPLPPISDGGRAQGAKPKPGMDGTSFISWRYQPEEVKEEYISDSALLELYRRLCNTDDRALLLDDVWSFHTAYGTGIFMRDRLFTVNCGGGLSPFRLAGDVDAYGLYEEERESEMKNAVRFMQGEHADNMLITGGPGTGKSMQVFALARELPELRLIVCPAGRIGALIEALPGLSAQPYKFMILLDDFDAGDPHWPQLRTEIAPGGMQPENILLAACSREAEDTFFPLRIRLAAPQLKEFIELVQLILWQKGKDTDYERIQNACIDYAAGANGVTFRSAGLIAQSLEL